MTAALLVGGLCSLAAFAVLRPLMAAGGRARDVGDGGPEEDRRQELLRQLRDLDEDLAQGKILEADHRRLRAPVEREAAGALRGAGRRAPERVRSASPQRATVPPVPARRRTLVRWGIAFAVVAAAAVGVVVLLLDAVDPRSAASPATGEAMGAAAEAGSAPGSVTGTAPVAEPPTAEQVAKVDAAVARVDRTPRSVSAHLQLARAYAEAGQRPLATIEYLAVTHLDRGNPEASTALALVAFTGGKVDKARELVDEVLDAHPGHPEALYARGVISMMGLNRPEAARRDLEAYLTAAPYGAHREAADTLLEIIEGQGTK